MDSWLTLNINPLKNKKYIAVCLIQKRTPGSTRGPAYWLERVMGIEPTSRAWKARVLPMNYTRICNLHYTINTGRDDWIRTSDPLLPKQMRYQTAPRPDFITKEV